MAVMLNDFIADAEKRLPGPFIGLATLPFDSQGSILRELDGVTGKLDERHMALFQPGQRSEGVVHTQDRARLPRCGADLVHFSRCQQRVRRRL